jgi:hypothetical protein
MHDPNSPEQLEHLETSVGPLKASPQFLDGVPAGSSASYYQGMSEPIRMPDMRNSALSGNLVASIPTSPGTHSADF